MLVLGCITDPSGSDVMMQYFSWFEYPIMNPVPAKTGKAQVVAFITNCGPNKRLKWLSEVQKHGVVVHSYGPCANNMPQLPRVGLWLEQKNNVTAAYKFTWAFENSEAKDYVTEKLFGPFTVGYALSCSFITTILMMTARHADPFPFMTGLQTSTTSYLRLSRLS